MNSLQKHQKKTIFLRIFITIFVISWLGFISYYGYLIYNNIFYKNNTYNSFIKAKKNLTLFTGVVSGVGINYWVFDPKLYDIRLFLNDDMGKRIGNFTYLHKYIQKNLKKKLIFATNAGMFHPNYKPVGLHISNGIKINNIDLGNGEGNFYLKPNGIFFIDKYGNAGIMETQNFLFFRGNKFNDLKLATQSGPLLLQNGKINPFLNPGSENRFIRSAVGVKDNIVYFFMSKNKMSFYNFTSFIKKTLKIDNLLYLDGSISDVYFKGNDVFSGKEDFVGIIGIVNY